MRHIITIILAAIAIPSFAQEFVIEYEVHESAAHRKELIAEAAAIFERHSFFEVREAPGGIMFIENNAFATVKDEDGSRRRVDVFRDSSRTLAYIFPNSFDPQAIYIRPGLHEGNDGAFVNVVLHELGHASGHAGHGPCLESGKSNALGGVVDPGIVRGLFNSACLTKERLRRVRNERR